MRKVIGRAEIEGTLKRLDKLTQKEARMAAAQNLKVTHTVDRRVVGVVDAVGAVDNRVAGVDDRVAGVDNRMQQTANDVDEVKRSSSPNLFGVNYEALPILPRKPIAGEHSQMALPTRPFD